MAVILSRPQCVNKKGELAKMQLKCGHEWHGRENCEFSHYSVMPMLNSSCSLVILLVRSVHICIPFIGFGDYTNLLWWNNINTQFCQLTARVWYQMGIRGPFKCTGNHTYWCIKITEACNRKMAFKICEGISCSSFSVKELDVVVHKTYFPCITVLNFGHSVPHITSEPGGWGGN